MHDHAEQLRQLAEQAHTLADALALRAIENGLTPVCSRVDPHSHSTRMCVKPWGHHGPCTHLRWGAQEHLWNEIGRATPLCCHPGPGHHVNCVKAHDHDDEHRYMNFHDADRMWGT